MTERTMDHLIAAALLLAAILIANTAWSQNAPPLYSALPSTPDISVSATATADYRISNLNAPARWIYLKNDCDIGRLHFDLRGARDGNSNNYSIALSPGESFSGAFKVYSVGVSPDSTAIGTCTFTLIPAE